MSLVLVSTQLKTQIPPPSQIKRGAGMTPPSSKREYESLLNNAFKQPCATTENKLEKIRRLSKPNRGVYKTAAEVDGCIDFLRS
jgi:hypothetical protein